MQNRMIRFDTISDLTNAHHLARLTGPIISFNTVPVTSVGFSGAELRRIDLSLEAGATRSFILKQTSLSTDWLAQRTHDRVGREGALLSEPALARIWSIVEDPYVAF